MTQEQAKEKAIALANKFVTRSVFDMNNEQLKKERLTAKRSAIITINEQVEHITKEKLAVDWNYRKIFIEKLLQVKQEIEKL
jgi:hypothetical protein